MDRRPAAHALALLAVTLLAGGAPGAAPPPGARCEGTVASALAGCVQRVGRRVRACHLEAGAPCPAGDARTASALAALGRKITAACPDAGTVQAAGHGPFFTPQSLADRMTDACAGEVATLAARSFGGPHAAALSESDAAGRGCLDGAFANGLMVLGKSLRVQARCIATERRGGACDQARVATRLADFATRAEAATAGACADLRSQIGLTPARFVAAAAEHARCLVATAHADAGPLALDCGPPAAAAAPPRGVWTRIVLDEATWGTRCGNGSAYAFWLRLAPEGAPIERVAIDLAGGGVCVFGSDCAAVSSSLFRATDDAQPSGGYMNTSATVNPFFDWTLLYLPYCTQDLHIGGGTTNVFTAEGITVHRFGAINVRTVLRYVRDVLWAALDDQDAEGYRPGRLRVLFAGESAGAFGVQYNYHYLLDELRWTRTTAVPDSGVGLDNGELFGVGNLGLITSDEGAIGWNTRPYQAPYCQVNACSVGPFLQARSAARLGVVPEQGFLNVSNQVDNTQVTTTFFANTASWVNALRASYCQNRGLPGVRYFLPARSTSIHTVLRSNTHLTSLSADGEVLGAWLAGAMADPVSTVDRVDEGTLTTSIAGVLPFPCDLGP